MKKDDLQEAYMRNLLTAMQSKGVKRVVNLSALGAGDSLNESPFFMRHILLPLMLKHVFADKDRGESLLLASGLDFVNVRPGRLLNSPARGGVKATLKGQRLEVTDDEAGPVEIHGGTIDRQHHGCGSPL